MTRSRVRPHGTTAKSLPQHVSGQWHMPSSEPRRTGDVSAPSMQSDKQMWRCQFRLQRRRCGGLPGICVRRSICGRPSRQPGALTVIRLELTVRSPRKQGIAICTVQLTQNTRETPCITGAGAGILTERGNLPCPNAHESRKQQQHDKRHERVVRRCTRRCFDGDTCDYPIPNRLMRDYILQA